jgi:hypothetical protein
MPPIIREHPMATLRRQIALDASAATVWSAVRDFGAVHTRVAAGFLTKLASDKGDRIVTFFNGLVARERLVTLDDEDCRLVYTVVEGRPSHYTAAVQVFPEGEGRGGLDDRSPARRTRTRDWGDDGSRRGLHEEDARRSLG